MQGCIEILNSDRRASPVTDKGDRQTSKAMSVVGLNGPRDAPQGLRALLSNTTQLITVSHKGAPVSPTDQISPKTCPFNGFPRHINGIANTVLNTLLSKHLAYPLKRGKQALELTLSFLV